MLRAELASWIEPPRPPSWLGQATEPVCPTWTDTQILVTIGALVLGALWGYFTAQGG